MKSAFSLVILILPITTGLLISRHAPLVTTDPDVDLSPDGKWLLVAEQDRMLSDIKIRAPY